MEVRTIIGQRGIASKPVRGPAPLHDNFKEVIMERQMPLILIHTLVRESLNFLMG